MLAALLPFLEAVIDETPSILTALEGLLAKKRQQYPNVATYVAQQTATAVASLEASEPKV